MKYWSWMEAEWFLHPFRIFCIIITLSFSFFHYKFYLCPPLSTNISVRKMGDFILRGWNWCRRFRHRCGYGVHSPSDFFFITFVIYERLPFYAYAPLHHLRRVVAFLPHYREKVDKFLFRLINHLRPSVVWEVGTGSGIRLGNICEV